MRDSLTVLAILLIAALTTALVGPYFVDWNAHRAAIEARLSALAGAPVTVRGPIDLKLLPKPVFHLGSVAIGAKAGPYGTIPGGSAAGPSLTADDLDAELSWPAMLRGEIEVVDATLRSPRLVLAQGADGAVTLPRLSSAEADRVAIAHVGVRDGSVVLQLADGRRVGLQNIDLDGEAASLRGPVKIRGSVGGLPLRLATGAFDGARLRAKLDVDPDGERPALDLDGTLTLAGGPFAFDGALSASGALPLRGTNATIPWRATAEVKADMSGAGLETVEIRAGDDLRALIADGIGTIARGAAADAPPDIALKLHGAGLDLDNLAVAPKDSGIAPPQGSALIGLLMQAVGDRTQGADLPVRLALNADVDTVTLAGRTLLGATLRLGLGREPGVAVALSTAGPDGTRLALDGQVLPGPVFRGRVDAAASDLPRLAVWLKPIAPELASRLAAEGVVHAVAVAGDLDASASRIAMRQAKLRLDDSRFTGSLAYDGTSDAGRPRLSADLATERLDLGAVPDLGASIVPGTDLDIALATPEVRLAGRASGLAGAPVAGGPLAVHLTRSGDDVDLDRFSLVVGGGSIAATASRTGTEARVEARVDAPALGPIAGILARIAPGPVTAAIAARATTLSPVSGTLRADAVPGPNGTLIPARVALDGTVGGTHLAATLLPEGEGADAWSRPVAMTLDAAAADAAVPLREIGLESATGAIGPVEAHATARGSLAAGFKVDAKATLGATAVTYAGSVEGGRGRGRLGVATPDLRPLLTGLGIVAPGSGGATLPADGGGDLDWSDARGTLAGITARVADTATAGDLAFGTAGIVGAPPGLSGRLTLDQLPAATLLALGLGSPTATADMASRSAEIWSAAPFAAAPVLPRGSVDLAIDRMPLLDGLEARDAKLTLRATRTGVSIAEASARLGGGSLEGAVDLGRDGPSATLAGRFVWHDVDVDLGGETGRIGGDLHLAGTGASPVTLLRNLGGTGTFTLLDATLARLDPDAPARTAAAFTVKDPLADPDPKGLDAAAIGKRLSDELDRGPLKMGRQSAALVATAGVLRIAALKSGASGAASATDVALDLGDLGLSLRTRLVPANSAESAGLGPPSGTGEVTVTDAGPLRGPLLRQVDASDLVDRLEAQAVARAQERIDVIEQDVRERAYFNRQLKAILADQAAARQRAAAAAKAAADARQSDAARAKADEARIQAETEAEKRRFIDRQVRGLDGDGADPSPSESPARRPHVRPHEPPDSEAPPSIVDDTPRATGQP